MTEPASPAARSGLLWSLRMAGRDGRAGAGRLLLLIAAVVAGVAALTAVRSFKDNLERAIFEQAKPLLGADLEIASRSKFSPEAEELLRRFGEDFSREVTFASMAYFTKSDSTRLVQVLALSGDFPYYGALETTPVEAATTYREGGKALVDRSLMLQFSAAVGDTVKIGDAEFIIEGILDRVPGIIDARSGIAPRIYIRLDDLERVNVLGKGSRARYKAFFRIEDRSELEQKLELMRPEIRELQLDADTVEEKAESFKRLLEIVYSFLDLMGFLALVLGGIGVGSSVQVYLERKAAAISVLRCLGASRLQAFLVYFLQVFVAGALAIAAGIVIGLGLQTLLPDLLAEFMPLRFELQVSVKALVYTAGVSMAFLLLFSMGPLLQIRRVSPLAGLRQHVEEPKITAGSVVISLLIFAVSAAYAAANTGKVKYGLGFALLIFASLTVLLAIGWVIRKFVSRFLPAGLPFAVHQGLANLHRPRNQTVTLMLSMGMGAYLLAMIGSLQQTVIAKAESSGEPGRPNMILFDIQKDQIAPLREFMDKHGLPLLAEVPMVTLRLAAINGRSVADIRADRSSEIPSWTLVREYRCTYRERLAGSEELAAGEFVPRYESNLQLGDPGFAEDKPVPVSLETGIAEKLGVKLGDELTWDAQGIQFKSVISSLRKVDWQRIEPNFFAVFPKGVLEELPQIGLFVGRAEDAAQSAAFQAAAVRKFPNVSMIDLSLVLKTLDLLTDKLSFVVRFMGLFSLATAVVVLVASALGSRGQRIRENVLLKTLGAPKRVVVGATLAEYSFLGVFAAASGCLLAVAGSWIVARYVLKTAFVSALGPIAAVFAAIFLLTLFVGLAGSVGTYRRPALEVLRELPE